MTQEYLRPHVSAQLILKKQNQILLLKRRNTGYEDGKYGLVSGHVNNNETASQALCREASEEAGINIKPHDVKFVHIMHRKGNRTYLDCFFEVTKWEGEPTNTEPEKCSDLSWFSADKLPANTILYVKAALSYCGHKQMYSEFGFSS